jgi:hypothetical protein
MSMPSINLDCEKCGYSGSTMVTWGSFNYRTEDQIIPVNRILGWCLDCDGLVPIEDFSNSNEILAEIKEILKPLKIKASKWLSINLFKYQCKNRAESIEKVEQLATQLNMIVERKGKERCLTCSSINVLPFDGDYRLEYEGLLYKGLKKTGFIHPSCGGEIIATPNPIRFNMRFEPKYYSPQGKREIDIEK